MDTALFYELRSRLYTAASAGAGCINEDFRLKRTLEKFAEEFSGSKAMMRLCELCGNIFSSDKKWAALAEAIALSDALAVAQGAFADDSETKPSEADCAVPAKDAPYSVISGAADMAFAASPNILRIKGPTPEIMKDPRVLAAFIKSLDRKELDGKELLFCKLFGRKLSSVLKNVLRSAPERAAANCVKLIRKISGSGENALYLSLAKNEELPDTVRYEAVIAMNCSYENVPALFEIYRTAKKKLKNAAELSLARLDPPEAEEIWKKYLEKPSASGDKVLSMSRSHLVTEYVRSEIAGAIYDHRHCTEHIQARRVYRLRDLLRNKYDCADIFEMLIENDLLVNDIKEILVENIYNNDDNEKYIALCEEVFSKRKEMLHPWLLMRLVYGKNTFKDHAQILNDNIFYTAAYLENIFYSPAMGKYVIPFSVLTPRGGSFAVVPDENVKEASDYLSDTDYIDDIIELDRLCSNPIGRLKALKETGGEQGLKDMYIGLMRLSRRICDSLERFDEKAAAKYAREVIKICPSLEAAEVLCRTGELTPENTRGVFTKYTLYVVKHIPSKTQFSSWDARILKFFPLPDEEILAELKELKKKLSMPMKTAEPFAAENMKKAVERLIEEYENKIRNEE